DSSGTVLASGIVSTGYYGYTPGIAFTAQQSGTVTVQYSAIVSYNPMASGTTTFNLVVGQSTSATYAVGSTVTGTLNQPVDTSTYQFTLNQPSAVWFDISGGDYSATLTRTDQPAGVFSFSGSPVGRRGIYQLAAGTYSLQMSPTQPSPGSFTIASSTLAALPALTLGTTNQVTLSQGNRASAFQFTGTAGQQFHIDARWVSGGSTSQSWYLLNASGQTVNSGNVNATNDTSFNVTLQATGTYVLYLVGS